VGFSPCKIACLTSPDPKAEELGAGAGSRNVVASKQTAALYVSKWKRLISKVFEMCRFLDAVGPCASDPTWYYQSSTENS